MNFDTIITVDWSAASHPVPARGRNSIWFCVADNAGVHAPRYCATRLAAEAALSDCIDNALACGARVLLGFDIALGFPVGFSEYITGRKDPFALWVYLNDRIEDTKQGTNNRFAVANAMNVLCTHTEGPFWGCTQGQQGVADNAFNALPRCKPKTYAPFPFASKRTVEIQTRPQPKSVWQLAYNGAVGSQSLMGLPIVYRLCQQFGGHSAVWPHSGVDSVHTARLLCVEVYFSLLGQPLKAQTEAAGLVRDAAETRAMAAVLWQICARGCASDLFALPPLFAAHRYRQEGWIIGAKVLPLLSQRIKQGV